MATDRCNELLREGATVMAAIQGLKQRGPSGIVVGVPAAADHPRSGRKPAQALGATPMTARSRTVETER